MAYAPNPRLRTALHPGVAFALLLTGAVGFALGQNWPVIEVHQSTLIPNEDWHGNVKRSDWGQDWLR